MPNTTTRSIISLATHVREMGLQLDALDAEPLLPIGVTMAWAHEHRMCPVDMKEEYTRGHYFAAG